jgi:hypothetical protein
VKHLKKSCIIIYLALIISGIGCWVLKAEEKLRLHIPFRVSDGIDRYKSLSKEDVKLLINELPQPIVDLVEQEKSISSIPELGRSFIFSFNTLDYNKKIADGVSYFLTEILKSTDMLFIITPQNVYRIPVSRNKLKMVANVEALVKKDCTIYSQRHFGAVQNLGSHINVLEKVFENPYIAGIAMTTSNFLKTYPPDFMKYVSLFLLPDIEKYRQVLRFIGTREGEKWCVHFQSRDLYSVVLRARKILGQIKMVFSSSDFASAPIMNAAADFESNLTQLDMIEAKPLLNLILWGDINFNAIFYGGLEEKNSDSALSSSNFVEKIYKQTSSASGGEAIDATNILKTVQSIIDHKDHFYDLIYDFDGQAEVKQVQIYLNDNNTNLDYKGQYSKEEIESMVYYLTSEKVTIEDFNQVSRNVSFSIRSFKLQDLEKDTFGILRVHIQLHDEWGNLMYSSERILRTSNKKLKNPDEGVQESETGNDTKIRIGSRSEKSVDILHSFPSKYKGRYIINISVTDFIRNCSTSITRTIDLKE